MPNKTNKIFFMAVICITAIFIYLFQSNAQQVAKNSFGMDIQTQLHTEPFAQKEFANVKKDTSSNSTIKKEASQKNQTTVTNKATSNNNAPVGITQTTSNILKTTEKIKNEEAEILIPYPFNLALGIFKDNDRETYKQFSDTSLSDDWDMAMQGQLVDAIYSHPYANALKIDSVVCRAHICEIRLLAKNTIAWPMIFADIRQQLWWEFGNKFSIYEFSLKEDSQTQTIYFV